MRFLGLALALVGYFGPWVPHESAALTVTGFELAHLTRLQGSPASITPALFLTPLVAAAILLGLLANQPTNQLTNQPTNKQTNKLLTLAAALLALAVLPPYQFILDAQYRGQLALAAGGLLLVLLTPLARWLPRRAWTVLVALVALAGAIPALWQFALLRPLVVALYDRPLGLGWGLVTCTAGFALLLISSIQQLAVSS
ncbi:MAG: hypothetical protein V3T90_01230 [Anaerolineae bacterium]